MQCAMIAWISEWYDIISWGFFSFSVLMTRRAREAFQMSMVMMADVFMMTLYPAGAAIALQDLPRFKGFIS